VLKLLAPCRTSGEIKKKPATKDRKIRIVFMAEKCLLEPL
jgi:hypothetical protein